MPGPAPPSEPAALVTGEWGAVVVTGAGARRLDGDAASVAGQVARLDAERAPRWVWWSARTAVGPLVAAAPGMRLRRCWDLAAVHRILAGGHRDDPGRVWALANGLDVDDVPDPGRAPRHGQLDLLLAGAQDDDDAPDDGPDDAAGGSASGSAAGRPAPLRTDGHLRPGWTPQSPSAAESWGALALKAQRRQQALLVERATGGGDPVHAAWAESAAELVAVELGVEGLPVDREAAEQVVAAIAGRRPRDDADEARLRVQRDASVLVTVPDAGAVDLRSPAQVRVLLRRNGFDLPDTRSWRMEQLVGAHPVIDALLAWRRAERVSTTYGYRWLDEHLGADGRLRGAWSGSDGGAGRMTAQGGLHSMPRKLRVAVRAEPGFRLVRADLGQVEPRVLAAVSGDPALARAAREDDLYATVAAQLRIDRSVAKVAFLAAMYGQTSGSAGEALRDMQRAYPVAMGHLERAAGDGAAGRAVRTWGGRRVAMWPVAPLAADADDAALRAHRSVLAARGRFARNAVVQGSAAELFKAWTASVRARLAASGAGTVVLCLHDELLLHVRTGAADRVAVDVVRDLETTAARWSPSGVRFVADVRVVDCWADAKG